MGWSTKHAVPMVVATLLAAAAASAESVSLPYVAPDGGASQWFVQQMGIVQQQGNQPVFGQAGMLLLNGQQPSRSANNADYDDKSKELSMAFMPVGPIRIARRIRFDDNGVIRIVDVFENPLDREASVNVSLMTNTNVGINDSQSIVDPKKKETTLGWVANTGADRAAMSLFGGKGSKLVPNVQYQANNNAVTAQLTLKVPAKSKRAIVHWHGTFENAEAALQWAGQLREAKETADLPADVRRALINVAPASPGLPDGMELLRGGATDVVELRGGDLLRGDLKVDPFVLRTDYGDVTIAAADVAGLLGLGEGRQWLVTRAGELLAGQLQRPTLPITLAGGQTVQVPVGRVTRLGYRSTASGAAGNGSGGVSSDATEWKLDKPMAFLASGERFLIDPPAEPFTFVCRYGTLTLTAAQVAAILLPPTAAAHQVHLSDGSRLSGVLTGAGVALRRAGASTTQPSGIPVAALARVQLRTIADSTTAGASYAGANYAGATIGLLGDDVVAARIDGTLTLVTAFDTQSPTLSVNGPEIRSIARGATGEPGLQITTADGSVFRGTVRESTIDVTLRAGPKLTLPLAALRDYDNPSPLPAAGVVAKASDAIARLNSDDWKTREAAEAELTAAGQGMLSVMEAALPTQPPEARDRLTTILRTLRKDQPATPSRLTGPPAVEP